MHTPADALLDSLRHHHPGPFCLHAISLHTHTPEGAAGALLDAAVSAAPRSASESRTTPRSECE